MPGTLHGHALTALLGLLVLAFTLADARAQDNPSPPKEQTQRLCQDEDLVNHVFKMVYFRETPPRKETIWVGQFPYHYLAFHPHNGYGMMAYNADVKSPKALGNDLAPTSARHYLLSNEGVLSLVENDKVKYLYRCVAVLKQHFEYVPGDLILTGYTKKRKSELYKLYRRWY